ncbi:MAG: mandelate racemase [Actinobacteria bacterium]|nr:mandelate racemase [Actinomycetota bacterium]
MRIVDIRERAIGISRYRDPGIPSGGLTTSLVAVVTDVVRGGRPVTGYGFASVGRYAQSGALDMALWDAAAKIARLPLHQFLAGRLGRVATGAPVSVYASGGYPYPDGDLAALAQEIRQFTDLGFTHAKIKIGAQPLDEDRRRIEAAAAALAGPGHLAVDAMNAYGPGQAQAAAEALAPFGLWWFEDLCDPLDFATHGRVAARYPHPIAAGEALFSAAEADLLAQHAGLRRDRDILLFDPVHCYGLPGYLRIIDTLTARGWPRRAFWPHGGQLFSLHLVAALGLGGAEANPLAFHPFHGPPAALPVTDGHVPLPDVPGIGFELHDGARQAFQGL